MKFKKVISLILVFVIMIGVIPEYSLLEANALTSGYYTYTVTDNEATITDCSTSISGNVTLPATLGGYKVVAIGDSAFVDCLNLSGITISKYVRTIGIGAFNVCTGITKVVLPDSLTYISDFAFAGCTGLKEITIPSAVTYIGEYAFNCCTAMETAVIEDGATGYIAYSAFRECTSLKNITLSNTLSGIGSYAFYGCTKLEGIDIKDGIAYISSNAFYNCTGMEYVSIPPSLTRIESSAFVSCTSLNAVYITDLEQWCKIDFYGSTSNPLYYAGNLYLNGELIKDIVIPNTITEVPYYAFIGSTSLESVVVPEGITRIGNCAFQNCTALKKVTLPSSLIEIYSSAFSGSTAIKDVYISDLASWCRISFISYNSNPLYYAENLYINGELITDIVIPEGTTRISKYAFNYFENLKSIILPDSLSYIDESAFMGCPELTAVNISNVNEWFDIGFYNQYSNPMYYAGNLYANGKLVTEILVPNDVETISSYKFTGFSCLENVYLHNGITEIEQYAFAYCDNIKSIVIPQSITHIGIYTFSDCTKLNTIIVPSTTRFTVSAFLNTGYYNNKENWENGVLYLGDYLLAGDSTITQCAIKDGTKAIAGNAFYGLNKLNTITIPNSVELIGSNAFYNTGYYKTSSNWSSNELYMGDCLVAAKNSYRKANVKSGTRLIADKAFNNCSSVWSVSIPSSVKFIGEDAFYGTDIGSVYVEDIAEWCSINFANLGSNPCQYYSYMYINNTKVTDTLTIPEGVTEIKDYALPYLYTGYGTITINFPKSLKKLGVSNLIYFISGSTVKINITDLESWLNVDFSHTLFGYNGSKNIYLYLNGEQITNLVIPESITVIKEFAFSEIDSITSVQVHSGVTDIQYGAFYNCSKLATINLPNKAINIGEHAFTGTAYYNANSNWQNNVLYIGNHLIRANTSVSGDYSVKSGTLSIADKAFDSCKSLTSVTLPDSVEIIGTNAFYSCDNMASIEVSEDNEHFCDDRGILYTKDKTKVLYIPAAYKWMLTINLIDCFGNQLQDSIVCMAKANEPYSVGIPEIAGYNVDKTVVSGIMPAKHVTIDVVYYEKTVVDSGSCNDNIKWTLYNDGMLVFKGTGDMPNYTSGNTPWAGNSLNILTVYIDPRITSVGDYAFENCSNLTFIDYGYSITSVGKYAFSGCTSVTSVSLPASVTTIAEGAYFGCTGIKNAVISDNIVSIEANAFAGCSALVKATIGANVTSIGANAFANCPKLSQVYLRGNPPTLGAEAFGTTAGKYIYYYSTISGWSEVILDGLWNGYIAIPYNAISKENFTGTNVYIIKVVDKNNNPLQGSVVNLGNNVQSTNEDGMAYFTKPNSTVELSVSCSNHITFSDFEFKATATQIMDVIELSDKPSVVQGVSCDGKSIATSVYVVNSNSDKAVRIIVSGYSKYEILRYELHQGNRLIATGKTNSASYTFTVNASAFEEGETVLVKMFTSDGNSVASALNIDVANIADISETQLFDELSNLELAFTLGDLGDVKLPLSFKTNEDEKIYTIVSGRTIRVGINIDINEFFDKDKGDIKSKTELQKRIDKKLKSFAEGTAGFEYKVCGYIEIEYLGDGEYYVKSSYVKISVAAGLSFNAQASYFGIVGVYFKASLSGEASLDMLISHYVPEQGFEIDDVNFTLENTLYAEGGAYLLWGAGSAGIYGKTQMGFVLGIVPDVEFESVYITGELGVKWSLFWGLFGGNYKILSGDIYRWPEAQTFMLRALNEAVLEASQNGTVTLNDRTYLENRSLWLPSVSILSNSQSSDGYGYLQQNIYYNVAPKIVTCGDTTVMVWLDDNSERDGSNFQTLYYSVYNNGIWSEPLQLDNNETFDCEFDLYTDGEAIYVIYTEQKSSNINVENIDINNEEDIQKLISNVEVAAAVFNGTTFNTPVRLTDNNSCEVLPTLTSIGDTVTAFWTATDSMGAAAEALNSDIYACSYQGNCWSVPSVYVENQNSVSDIKAVYLDGKLYFAYVADADGNIETTEDTVLVLLDDNGNARQIDIGIISNLQSATVDGKTVLVWYNNGAIYMLSGADSSKISLLSGAGVTVNSNYQIFNISDDKTLITFTMGNTEEKGSGTDIYCVYIGANGAESAVIRLTETEGYIDNYAISYVDGKFVTVFTETFVDTSLDEVQTVTHLRNALLEFSADISLDTVNYDITGAVSGGNLEVTLGIDNVGSRDINGIKLNFYNESGSLIYSTSAACDLKAGELKEISLALTLPLEITDEAYSIEVLPIIEGEIATSDKNMGDNAAKLTLGYSDFSVIAEQKIVGEKNYIILSLTNEGNIASSAEIKIYAPDMSGEMLTNFATGIVASGASEQYFVDISALTDSFDEVITAAVVSNGYDPYSLNNLNTVSLLHINGDAFTGDPEQVVNNPIISVNSVKYDKYFDYSIVMEILDGADGFDCIDGLNKSTDYSVENGVITLNSSYLKALDVGSYDLDFVFDFGYDTPTVRTVTVSICDTTPVQLNGTVRVLGNVAVNNTVYADVSDLTPLTASLKYNWSVDGVTVGEDSSYTISANDYGKNLKLTVTGINGYVGEFSCSQTVDYNRPDAPSSPIILKVESTSVTLVKAEGVEYSIDKSVWQEENVFDNLLPNTKYTFYARVKAEGENSESDASTGVTVTTLKLFTNAPAAPTAENVTDSSVTLTAYDGYLYSMDGENWQSGNVFRGLLPNTQYTFYQKIAETDSSYESSASSVCFVTTKKITPARPVAPSIVMRSDTTVTLEYIEGYEYSIDGITWQNADNADWSGHYRFTGLSPATEYAFYQRVAETETAYASEISEALVAKTWKSSLSGPSAPVVEEITANSITLQYNPDYEYKIEIKGGISGVIVDVVGNMWGSAEEPTVETEGWQSSNVFTGLSPNVEYTVYQRYKETDVAYPSKSSAGVDVTTKKNITQKPLLPVVSTYTYNTITVEKEEGYEYSLDGVVWQDDNTFENLSPNTEYTVYSRVKETEASYASEASDGVKVTTKKQTVSSPEMPQTQNVTDTTVTLVAVSGCEYRVGDSAWQSSNVFSGLLPNNEYIFSIRYKETETTYASEASGSSSVVTLKSTVAAPQSPKVLEVTDTTVTLEENEEYEYRIGDSAWQSSNVFSGLLPNNEYIFSIRYKETETTYASEESGSSSVVTLKATVATPQIPEVLLVTDTTVTLAVIEGCEYRMGSSNWQSSSIFVGLSPNKEYTFSVRYMETETTYASEASDTIKVTTLKSTVLPPKAPELIEKTDTTVVLKAEEGFEYRVGNCDWQSSNVFENLEADTEYVFYQRVAETDTEYASQASQGYTITTYEAYTVGDINGDQVIDFDDVYVLSRYVADWDLVEDQDYKKAALDTNGDGKITLPDVVLLSQFIAGWEVELSNQPYFGI